MERILVPLMLMNSFILQYANSQVYWNLSSAPAIFGQDVVLTCYLGNISSNPTDCPVRQWSGGPKRIGLVYNGYSSDKSKYEEYMNLKSSAFALVITNLTDSDINANYTCSCGFDSSTKNLTLDENTFHYPPIGINVTFTVENYMLLVTLELRKVYPVPNCSLLIEDSFISKNISVMYNKNGLFYGVKYNAVYTLSEQDCNKQPLLKCIFGHIAEQMIFTGNATYDCPGSKKIRVLGWMVHKNKPKHLINVAGTDSPNIDSSANILTSLSITLIVALLLLAFIIASFVYILKNKTKKERCLSKRKKAKQKEIIDLVENENCIYLN